MCAFVCRTVYLSSNRQLSRSSANFATCWMHKTFASVSSRGLKHTLLCSWGFHICFFICIRTQFTFYDSDLVNSPAEFMWRKKFQKWHTPEKERSETIGLAAAINIDRTCTVLIWNEALGCSFLSFALLVCLFVCLCLFHHHCYFPFSLLNNLKCSCSASETKSVPQAIVPRLKLQEKKS